jgi:glutamine amidotransferase
MEGIADGSEFYFLHSFHFADVQEPDRLAETEFDYNYVSAIEKENIFGTQFHPEKSHNQGMLLLRNFIQL